MEQKYKKRMKQDFMEYLTDTEIQVLDIDDVYQYMDAELVEILEETVGAYLGEFA